MAVARAGTLRPLHEKAIPVNQRALVVGGGVAGMNAALGLADQGFEVVLVEKEEQLGGMANRLTNTIEGDDVQAYLEELIRTGDLPSPDSGPDPVADRGIFRIQGQFHHRSAGGPGHV